MLKFISDIGIPVAIDAGGSNDNGLQWIEDHHLELRSHVEKNGAVLVRNLKVSGTAYFAKMLTLIFGSELIEYIYRSTPRTKLRGNVYTATEYPSTESIPQHNENSYAKTWPRRLGFMCISPADTGGETPIGDTRLIASILPTRIWNKFEKLGILYVRNYSHLDIPWQVVFQTEDRIAVEIFCQDNGLQFEWLDDGTLRTSQVNPAIAIHPSTGDKLWFNQAHLFHVSTLGAQMAKTLIDTLGEKRLPRNAYYGDGTPIDPGDLAVIRAAYDTNKIKFKWQKNDLLLLDNMLYHHGREPYAGPRKVLVGMALANHA